MKKISIYYKEFLPFEDITPDPEDRSTRLYQSKEDRITSLLNERYIDFNDKHYLILRNNKLTKVSVNKVSIDQRPYERLVFVTTEGVNDVNHPKELTDLLDQEGFKTR